MVFPAFRNASRLCLNNSNINRSLLSLSRWSRWTAHQSANFSSSNPATGRDSIQEYIEKLLKMDRKLLIRMDMASLPRSARLLVHTEWCRRKVEDMLKPPSSSSPSNGGIDFLNRTAPGMAGKLHSPRSGSSSKSSSYSKGKKGDEENKKEGKCERGDKEDRNESKDKTAQPTNARKESVEAKVVDGYHLHSELAKVASTFGYKLEYDRDLQASRPSFDQHGRNMSALFTCSNGCQDTVRPNLPRTWSSSVLFTEFWFSSGYEGMSHPVRYRSSSHSQICSQCNHFAEPELLVDKYISIAMSCIDRWIHGEKDDAVNSGPWQHHK